MSCFVVDLYCVIGLMTVCEVFVTRICNLFVVSSFNLLLSMLVKVERTKYRPIACGEITRLNAFAFLGLPLSASLALLLMLNWNTYICAFRF